MPGGHNSLYGHSYTNRRTAEADLLHEIVQKTRAQLIDPSAEANHRDRNRFGDASSSSPLHSNEFGQDADTDTYAQHPDASDPHYDESITQQSRYNPRASASAYETALQREMEQREQHYSDKIRQQQQMQHDQAQANKDKSKGKHTAQANQTQSRTQTTKSLTFRTAAATSNASLDSTTVSQAPLTVEQEFEWLNKLIQTQHHASKADQSVSSDTPSSAHQFILRDTGPIVVTFDEL